MTTTTPRAESITEQTTRLKAEILQAEIDAVWALAATDHRHLVDAWNARLAATNALIALQANQIALLEAQHAMVNARLAARGLTLTQLIKS